MLAGVAAGWALGLSQDVLATGVKTFGLALPDPATVLSQRAKQAQPARKPAAVRK